MPDINGITDPEAEWSTDDPEDTDTYYYGSVMNIAGIIQIVYDLTTNPPTPPAPKYVRPPGGEPVDPPRTRRVRNPPPTY